MPAASLLRRWWPALAWMLFIFIMSSRPHTPPIPLFGELIDDVEEGDKLKHFVGYAVLGILVWRSLGSGYPKWRRFWLSAGISAVYGATDEFHQHFVVGRSCDFWDWTADAVGASIGAMIISLKGGLRTWQSKIARTKLTK